MGAVVVPLLQTLVKQKGSDLHIASNSSPMIRVRGELAKIEMPPHKPAEVEALVSEIITPQQKAELAKEKTLDFAIKVPSVGIFRVNIFFQRFGLSCVFRALSEIPPTMEQLKVPQVCYTATTYSHGLVLVCGPTGSGKSTTLAAMINHINTNQRYHILTIEDPIEFQHETKRCMVNQRQLGQGFTTFASALKAALREDPDVILVGEMRDPETIALAITAAETGHLVFGTLHTNTAAKSVDRIIDSFPGDQQNQIRSMLAESLRCVIAQKLIPTADKQGRVCAHDILVVTPGVANQIREGKTYQIPSMMQTGKKDGMQVMDNVIMDMVKQGVISGPDAYDYCNEKTLFMQWAPKDQQFGMTQAGASQPSATVPGMATPKPQIPTPVKKAS